MAIFSQTLNGNFQHDKEIVEDFLDILQNTVYEFEDVVVYQSDEPILSDIETAY